MYNYSFFSSSLHKALGQGWPKGIAMSMHRPELEEQPKKKHCRIKGTRPASEDDDTDRISDLPTVVIDCILQLMPVQDAARTSVLSSKWRYIWANHPKVVLNGKFWNSMIQKRLSKELPIDFAIDTLHRILVHHIGHINTFGLDMSHVRSERHCDVDLWISSLCRRGVKVLGLGNSSSKTPYTVPSCVFSNSDLTHLRISNCTLKIIKSWTSLYKLQTLILENLTLPSSVLVMPLLSSLTLKCCHGIHDFSISASRLVSLEFCHNDDLNLVPYLACSSIRSAYIKGKKKIDQVDCEGINLMKVLSCWLKISEFALDGSVLKYLTMGIVPKDFPLKLSVRRFWTSDVNLNVDQMAWVLHILQNSPLLHRFQISFLRDVTNDMEVANHLEEPNVMNQWMEQLRVLEMKYFRASRTELLFTKILLSSAPSLKRILVEEDETLGLSERLRISKELMRLPRAFPNVEIIFGPNVVADVK